MRITLAVALTMSLVGCTVGSPYSAPTPTGLGSGTNVAAQYSSFFSDADPTDAWWIRFGDAELLGLVKEAEQHNFDVRLAVSRVMEVRASKQQVRGRWFPQIGVGGSALRVRNTENSFNNAGFFARQGLLDLEDNLYQAHGDMLWELDLFGHIQHQVEAANALTESALYVRDDVLRMIFSEVAMKYFMLRGTRQELAALQEVIALQKETVEYQRKRKQVGVGTQLDLLRAKAQLRTTIAAAAPLRAQAEVLRQELAVLVGKPPQDLELHASERAASSNIPDVLPIRFSTEVLMSRPDIRSAEQRLRAAHAGVNQSIAELYPRVSLFGAYGLETVSSADFLSSSSALWRIGPGVQWPIFQGGRLRAKIDVKKAQRDQALIRYEQVALRALQEVESALVSYAEVRIQREELRAAVDSSREAVTLAKSLYEGGLTEFLTVLDSEKRLQEAVMAFARVDKHLAVSMVQVFRSLGGRLPQES